MGYASRSGRARTSASSPNAFAVCQRCGQWWNYDSLKFQYDWRGASMQNLFLRVCEHCYDTPQEQLRTIVVPADPLPKVFATVEPFLEDETDYRTTSGPVPIDPVTGIPMPSNVRLLTQDGQDMTLIPVGAPTGLDANAIMPLVGNLHFGDPLPLLSVVADILGRVNVTCAAPHGLLDNSQVAALATTDPSAEGMFSVIVVHAEAFYYQPVNPPAVGSLLTSTTRIVTAKIGLPRSYPQIPLV